MPKNDSNIMAKNIRCKTMTHLKGIWRNRTHLYIWGSIQITKEEHI